MAKKKVGALIFKTVIKDYQQQQSKSKTEKLHLKHRTFHLIDNFLHYDLYGFQIENIYLRLEHHQRIINHLNNYRQIKNSNAIGATVFYKDLDSCSPVAAFKSFKQKILIFYPTKKIIIFYTLSLKYCIICLRGSNEPARSGLY